MQCDTLAFENASALRTRRVGQNFQSQFALIESPTTFQAVVIVTRAIDVMWFTNRNTSDLLR